MQSEHVNLLTIKEFHIIYSDITKKIYIDDKGRCYLFEIRSEAEQFINQVKNVYLSNARHIKQIEFCTEFFAQGVNTIRAKIREKSGYIDIPLAKGDAKKQYYNENAQRAILQILHTNKRAFLKEFASFDFLSPIKIEVRQAKKHPIVHHCYASTSGDDRYYVLFSTLQEFNSWNETQGNKWNPLKINLAKLKQVRGNNKVVINPLSDALIFDDAQIKEILGEKT